MKGEIKRFDIDSIQEGPLETGKLSGMALADIVDRYLDGRNRILTILRIYAGKDIKVVAKELGIEASKLEALENHNTKIPFQLVPKLSKIFNVDLKLLLSILGHVNTSDIAEAEKSFELGLAAQYSGPELTKQEKVDLEKLFKIIVSNSKKKSSHKK